MTRYQMTQRMILAAFAVVLVLPGREAAAESYAEGSTSGAGFKGYCEDGGGIFTDTEDGNLWCQWDDDSQTLCDEDGQDCHDIAMTRPPGGRWDSPIGTVGEWTADGGGADPPASQGDGTTSPAEDSTPVAGGGGAASAQPHLAGPGDDQNRDQVKDSAKKVKNGKKGKKGSKHRKR
jgi:hypothetical protein